MFRSKITLVKETANELVLKTKCPFCGKEYEFTIPFGREEFNERMRVYNAGAMIQEVFGDLSPSLREAMKTGICDECWDAM